jgi:hypothetical protein
VTSCAAFIIRADSPDSVYTVYWLNAMARNNLSKLSERSVEIYDHTMTYVTCRFKPWIFALVEVHVRWKIKT